MPRSPRPGARGALARRLFPVAGAAAAVCLLLCGCGTSPAAATGSPLQQAILVSARRKAHVGFRSCAVQWQWKLGPADGAAAFTCVGRAGALFAGAAYTAASAPGPAHLVALEVGRDDRATAFSEEQIAGLRQVPASATPAAPPQHYLVIAGIVNRPQIQAMTAVFSDGNLSLTTINSSGVRIYAFVNTGAKSTVRTITALGATGKVLFTAPPFPPRAH